MVNRETKERKRAALQNAKRRRNGLSEHSSALDTYDPTAANDVQDVVDREEEDVYRARVEANRMKEDFVVDDGTFCSVFSVFL